MSLCAGDSAAALPVFFDRTNRRGNGVKQMNWRMNKLPQLGAGAFGSVLTAATVAVLALGCVNETPDQLVASAHTYLAQGNPNAAMIQVRNALQQRPEDGALRLLLGRVLLESRDPVAAERELRKALQYGQPADAVLPALSRAMLESGAVHQLVDEFGTRTLTAAESEAQFKSALGQAQLQTGRSAEAAASFAAAAAASPGYVPALIGLARLVAVGGRLKDAVRIADRLVADHPKSAAAHMLLSDLRSLSGDHAGSIAALEDAISADGGYTPARYALMAALIDQQQFDVAAAHLEQVRSLNKRDLRIQYFDAVIALSRNDLVKARGSSQQILRNSPEHVPSLVLAGAVELQAKQLLLAENLLQRAISLAPQHTGARRMLVRTYLVANQPAKALEALQPLLTRDVAAEPLLQMLAGETYLANGDMREASAYYAAASESRSQEALAQTRLGQIALVTGDFDSGIRQLEAVTAQDDAPIQADLALIAGYVRGNELDRGLQAGQRLVKRQPGRPIAYQLLGSVYLAKKDSARAREQFEKALELSPGYLPAATSLSRLEIEANKPAAARQRFAAIVASEPNNEQALLGLADVMLRTGAAAPEIAATLQRATLVNPGSSSARFALIAHYLRVNDPGLALAAAQEAAAALPNDLQILYALGRAQEAAGLVNQAIETFNRLSALEPQSRFPLMQLAAVHARRADYGKLVNALQRAQRISANDPAMVRDLVAGYLLSGKPEDAVRQARALQASAPKMPAGYLLEGDARAAAKQWADAERAYRAGLKTAPHSGVLALRLHGALVASDQNAEAEAFAKKWLAGHPKDTVLRVGLAERALRAGNLRSAVAYYQPVIEQDPNNVVALNNLAWAAGQIGDPRALGYAQRAVQIAPQNAAALDTLGSLLIAAGDAENGVEYLGRAKALAPDRSDIRLNYAKGLIKAGKRDAARSELEALQAVPDAFAGKAEIAAVLKGL